jgi:hypothetical protein
VFAGSDGIRGENPEASQNVAYYNAIADSIKGRRSARIEQTTVLAPIPGTSKAVSQVVEVNNQHYMQLNVLAKSGKFSSSTHRKMRMMLQTKRKQRKGMINLQMLVHLERMVRPHFTTSRFAH